MKFAAAVAKMIAEGKPSGPSSWYSRLDDEAKKELDEIKSRFKQGLYANASRRLVARAITSAAKERGWVTCGEKGVIEWLSTD